MKRQFIGLALSLALLGAGSAQAVVIDNFTTGQAELEIPPPAPPASDSNTLNNVSGSINVPAGGGSRTLELTVASSGLGLPANTEIFSAGLGFFNLNAGSQVTSTASVTWDLDSPVNLLAAPNTYPGDTTGCSSVDDCFIIFGVDGLDQSIAITVTLQDSDGDIATNTYFKYRQQVGQPAATDPSALTCSPTCPQIVGSIFGDPLGDMFGNYYHGLAPFLTTTNDPATGAPFGTGVPTLDLTSIAQISFSITTASSALDFTVDCIYTSGRATTDVDLNGFPVFTSSDGNRNACTVGVGEVPEPASLLLMGTGLLGIGLAGLRTRKMRRRQA